MFSSAGEFGTLDAQIKEDGNTNLLVIAEGFQGWSKGGEWGDMTFMMEHDHLIDRIALIADEKWKEKILMFMEDIMSSFQDRRSRLLTSFSQKLDCLGMLLGYCKIKRRIPIYVY